MQRDCEAEAEIFVGELQDFRDEAARRDGDAARAEAERARLRLRNLAPSGGARENYVLRSPINGVVLEKLVNPDELVMPQSFGGGRGRSNVYRGADLRYNLEIGLEEAARGTETKIRIPAMSASQAI